jgi:hypothetical protein
VDRRKNSGNGKLSLRLAHKINRICTNFKRSAATLALLFIAELGEQPIAIPPTAMGCFVLFQHACAAIGKLRFLSGRRFC